MKITIDQIKDIAKDIIDDTEWVNDSETQAEHRGIVSGLESLVRRAMKVRHLKELEDGV